MSYRGMTKNLLAYSWTQKHKAPIKTEYPDSVLHKDYAQKGYFRFFLEPDLPMVRREFYLVCRTFFRNGIAFPDL